MPSVELTDQEWQTLTMMLAKQPWEIANPILFKMARQVSSTMSVEVDPPLDAWRPDGQRREPRSGP